MPITAPRAALCLRSERPALGFRGPSRATNPLPVREAGRECACCRTRVVMSVWLVDSPPVRPLSPLGTTMKPHSAVAHDGCAHVRVGGAHLPDAVEAGVSERAAVAVESEEARHNVPRASGDLHTLGVCTSGLRQLARNL
eukprot:1190949-Pyramimonas_sp.AAC.2